MMKSIIAVSLIVLAGCADAGGSNAPPADLDLPLDPETVGLSWEVIDRIEEHFGERVGIQDDGEYDDGEHYLVNHNGEKYVVVYDLEEDVIINVSKAGTL